MHLETVQTLHRKFWQWLKDQIAQDVPEANGLCEYDCRKQQCAEEEWATCERRIHKAAGELWPESSPAPRGERKPGGKPSRSAPQSPETEGGDYRPIPVLQPVPSQPSPMTPGSHPSINEDDIIDVALHHEIKCRAYEFYERQHDTAEGHDLKDKLQAELPRVAYAAAQLQKYSKGEIADTRAVRGARVYLRALSFFIGQYDQRRSNFVKESEVASLRNGARPRR